MDDDDDSESEEEVEAVTYRKPISYNLPHKTLMLIYCPVLQRALRLFIRPEDVSAPPRVGSVTLSNCAPEASAHERSAQCSQKSLLSYTLSGSG